MSSHKDLRLFLTAFGLVMVVAVLSTAVILAAPQGPSAGFSVPWWTVDSGGGTSQGGGYTVSGTAGQPDAGTLSGGGYALTGGYWSGALSNEFITYLPQITR
jgi:hypothetical protein